MSKQPKIIKQLYTRWGKALDKEHVLEEYPRPLMQRDSYICLNGTWEYAITKNARRPAGFGDGKGMSGMEGTGGAPGTGEGGGAFGMGENVLAAGRICVPFSPETLLSGVNRQLQPDEYLWYRRMLEVDAEKMEAGERLLLHFGAVDQHCRVYIDGKEAARHTGGYLPFTVDVTSYVGGAGNCAESVKGAEDVAEGAKRTQGDAGRVWQVELSLVVKDVSDTSYHARGKQKLERGGMYYTAQSGIWQTVWMEYVPRCYIEELDVQATVPDESKKAQASEAEDGLKSGMVRVTVKAAENLPVEISVEQAGIYSAGADGKEKTDGESEAGVDAGGAHAGAKTSIRAGGHAKVEASREVIASVSGKANQAIEIVIPDARLWNCETPYLYYFTVKMGTDEVRSYFAIRTFSVEPDEQGIPRICLNHEPQFQKGVLDQGYWPDGLYTAPADEALIYDIETMKSVGFNMIRKHIKIEPQRWYYHCDRLGMVVWQDMVNGGTPYRDWYVTYVATALSWKRIRMGDGYSWLLSRKDKKGKLEFVREMKETIHLLKGHPSIATWVIFNEGWGQFSTRKMTEIARGEDDTRLIDSASGWFDQGCGDLQSVHNYFFKLEVKPEKKRAAVLSEFGGVALQVQGHSACEELYGYGTYTELDTLNQAYKVLDGKVRALIPEGLCASVYTQVSDVEEEVNGVLTFDREIQKIK